MAELFFQYGPDPFLFDTAESKLYLLSWRKRTEITNSTVRKHVRLDSIEIDRKQALKLAQISRRLPCPSHTKTN